MYESSFDFHEQISKAEHLVTFKEAKISKAENGDVCILGLDVGSTTTKAVLINEKTRQIVASFYGRTNGNPIEASKECYKAISEQIKGIDLKIIGLGVTGSGRQIAALHALSEFVVNEIIAHATAATYFDQDVDTIFEIGGQDAKYTYLTSGVPSDYAMNEACSAGTGSFLEESAKESLNVETVDIGDLALQGKTPPNFTDQCAAFISSDIKLASQEGIERNDILAGLVYSICMNYMNRVKESRPVGKKIFMQGGVCYNKAIPIAMASLIKTQIIVPPSPGLMGAFGVALEVKKQIDLGLVKPADVNLDELAKREAKKVGSFICSGGKEKCDRKCEISKIEIAGQMHPFGGACDRYYNLRFQKTVDASEFDYVAIRERLLFEKYIPTVGTKSRGKIGIMRSFLTHAMFVLYANFFSDLGFEVVLSDVDQEGINRIEAAFCLPAEISHGSFLNLIKKDIDYIFLPHIMEIPVENVETYSRACVFVQGEPYYLKTTFRKEIEESKVKIISPILRMNKSYKQAMDNFINELSKLGISKNLVEDSYINACKKQKEFEAELLVYGKQALDYLDKNKEAFGIVLVGRPYNAFASDVNMGIPHKVATRGILIIPFDMLPLDSKVDKKIYWAMGQKIMKAAQFIKEKENLFGFYITNFSCGPDSFILGYFRNLMGMKPSLTLELDQHTADAGIDTRIEAALSIMKAYKTELNSPMKALDSKYKKATVIYDKKPRIIASDGVEYSLKDPKVEVIFPSMGKYSTQATAAAFRSFGINAKALPIPDKDVLLKGKKNALCKECLPYLLTTGSFLNYIEKKETDNVTLFFMATGSGPCRLGQYAKALGDVIVKNKLENVAVFTLTDENAYAGLGNKILLRGWQAILVADILNEIKSMLKVVAVDPIQAMADLENYWENLIMPYFEGQSMDNKISSVLEKVSKLLSQIPLKQNPKDVPIISLIGEIYVRNEEFSRKDVTSYLESHGFMVKVAPISEYICYSNYVINKKLTGGDYSYFQRIKTKISSLIQTKWERKIKSIFAKSNLYKFEMIDVEKTLKACEHLINLKLEGEAVLTVGLALREILNHSCGVVSIGPFGCMPSRVAESVLRREMNMSGQKRLINFNDKNLNAKDYEGVDVLPCLFLETDGNPFPQLVEANLESFILQAKRLHERMNHKT